MTDDRPEIPRPPVFATVEEERQHRKERLAIACRVFARLGFEDGVSGHITARDPGDEHHFWVNPFGRHLDRMRVSDLVLVNERGEAVEGEGRVNKAAFSIHAPLHAARPDVVAAAHMHSIAGRTWSTLGRLLAPITQDHCMFWQDHAVHDAFNGVVLDVGVGKAIAEDLGVGKAVILQNHGLLTVGGSVDEAAFWFIAMDRCCRIQLDAEAAGAPIRLDAEVAAQTYRQNGTPLAGWFNFQPYVQWIVEEEPEVLD